jgi:DeoR family transcriptional regulator, fructose operon transcriptional repressor
MTVVDGAFAPDERLRWLGDRLDADGSITIAGSAEALGVSEMTIRRDLAELEDRGTARRVRGGARAVGPRHFAERHHRATRAKSRIAAKLVELVPATGVTAFDASSTLQRAAARVIARDLTVLTNGPDTFAVLQGRAGIVPLLTGGRLDAVTGSLVGPLACRAASQFAVDTFFTSAAAVDVRAGALEATLEEAEVKRCLAANARRVVLAADSSKLGQRGVAVALEWDRVHVLVTELDPRDRRLDRYHELTSVR